eukprot:1442586-Alexandrium_andersonii.AAC.1
MKRFKAAPARPRTVVRAGRAVLSAACSQPKGLRQVAEAGQLPAHQRGHHRRRPPSGLPRERARGGHPLGPDRECNDI